MRLRHGLTTLDTTRLRRAIAPSLSLTFALWQGRARAASRRRLAPRRCFYHDQHTRSQWIYGGYHGGKRLAAVPGSGPHWYGKTAARPGRKMGHVTICGRDENDLARRLAGVRDLVGEDGMPGEHALVEVGVIMGSDSDLPCMQAATNILDEFNVSYEVTIVSAHRTPERMFNYAKTAFQRGLKVIIAGAGGAAHLPGMVAAMTPLPVIGVPVKTSALSGVDSLVFDSPDASRCACRDSGHWEC